MFILTSQWIGTVQLAIVAGALSIGYTAYRCTGGDQLYRQFHKDRKERAEGRTDSGIRYCVVHHGVMEQDANVCDFASDDSNKECITRPLFYNGPTVD